MLSLDQVKNSIKKEDKDWENQFKLKKEKLEKKSKFAASSFQKDNKMTFSIEIDVVNAKNSCCGFNGITMENILDKKHKCVVCKKEA